MIMNGHIDSLQMYDRRYLPQVNEIVMKHDDRQLQYIV